MPDTPTLLANASAGQLLDDARRLEDDAKTYALIIADSKSLTGILAALPEKRERCLRLAALARAVAIIHNDHNATIGPAYKRDEQAFGVRLQTDSRNIFEPDGFIAACADHPGEMYWMGEQ